MEYPIAIAAAAGLYTIMDSNRNDDRRKEYFSNSFPSSTTKSKGGPEKTIYEYGNKDLAAKNYIDKTDHRAFNTEFKSDDLKKTSKTDEYFDNSVITSLTGNSIDEKNFKQII